MHEKNSGPRSSAGLKVSENKSIQDYHTKTGASSAGHPFLFYLISIRDISRALLALSDSENAEQAKRSTNYQSITYPKKLLERIESQIQIFTRKRRMKRIYSLKVKCLRVIVHKH